MASAAGLLASCSDKGTGSSITGVDLIQNSSFESGGAPSLQYWTRTPADTALVQFSADVPAGGGSYSITIAPGPVRVNNDSVEGAVYTTIAAPAGTHVYKLSVWAKAANWYDADMYVDFLRLSSHQLPVYKESPEILFPTWMQYTMLDTITANAGDSITIGLEAGTSARDTTGKVYFDLCTFTAIN